MLKIKRDGQTALEYVILLTILMGALLTGGIYLKRGIQGRWKEVSDDLGEQYDPRTASTSVRHILMSNTDTRIVAVNAAGGAGVVTTRFDVTNSIETKTGAMSVGPF